MKKWVVYCHLNKINGKRYIGITCKKPSYRWDNGKGYCSSRIFNKAIQKYGWNNFEHIILETDLTRDEAKLRECYWISYYHTYIKDPACHGYNGTEGGDVPWNVGMSLSPEQKSKWEVSVKNNINWTHKGQKRNPEVVKKIRDSHKKYSKQILCVETGEIFESVKAAERKYHNNHINDCCNGKRKTACGFHWKLL